MIKTSFLFDIDKFKELPRLSVRSSSMLDDNSNGPRVLFVCDYIPYKDIDKAKAGEPSIVLGDMEGQVLSNVLKAVTRDNDGFKEFTVFNWYNVDNDLINYNNFENKKAFDTLTRNYANERLRKFILKMKPNVVFFSGMEPFVSYLEKYNRNDFPKNVNLYNKFGRLLNIKVGSFETNFIGSLDIRRAGSQKQEDIKKYPNLLGFFASALDTARRNENRYNIELGKIKYNYINTIEKFDLFYRKLLKKDIVSIDSETLGLGRISNKLFSIQFTFNRNDKESYFIPLDHTDTPFNKNELLSIKNKLRKYFEIGQSVFHIYQNGKFDIQQFIEQLGVRYYNHHIYDVMAGEYALDENRKLLAKKGGINAVTKPFSLDAIAEYYGCDIYSRIAFSKGDRGDMSSTKLDKKFIKYSCLDTVVPIHIVRCQLQEAKRVKNRHFKRFILHVISNTILAIAQMEHTGALLDKKYVFSLKSHDSPLDKQINDTLKELYALPNVKKANRLLIEKNNIPIGFKQPFIFNINKEESKQVLFFKTLKLEPTQLTKKGTGAVNRQFKDKYKHLLEIQLIDKYEKLKKLKTTYVDGFFNKLTKNKDSKDSRIRSDYIWNEISTGRLSSRDPNLQNIISRGELAKAIKRTFIAGYGKILIKNDYSAHEVRGWANIANDKRLSKSFDSGLMMRRRLRILMNKNRELAETWRNRKEKIRWGVKEKKKGDVVITPAGIVDYNDKKNYISKLLNNEEKEIASLELELEVFGDIHKLNVQHFWGTHPLEVTEEQRYAVKAVVFGVIYGKTAPGLAETLNTTEEKAQEIIDLLFEKFKEGGDWIKTVIREAQRVFHVISPAGMVRHLWAYLHNKQGVRSAMDRRGPNSIIQGLASQQGVDSMRNLQTLFWEYFIKRNIDVPWKIITNYVHDSVESENYIHLLPLHLYFMEHAATTLVHKNYEDIHGMKFKVGLEIEFQMGPSMDKLDTWKWGLLELRSYAEKTLDWQGDYYNIKNHSKIKKRIMRAFDINADLIFKIRAKELKGLSGKSNVIERDLILKPQHMKKLKFVYNVNGVN